jgi:hypothetical protein
LCLSTYRVDSCDPFVGLSSVLDNGLELRQTMSDAEYLLQLLVVIDNDDVAPSVAGDILTRIGRVRGVDASRQTPVQYVYKYKTVDCIVLRIVYASLNRIGNVCS